MFTKRKAGVALALAALPLSIGLALAGNGPITHDYSGSNASPYTAPGSNQSSSKSSPSKSATASNGKSSNSSGTPYKVKCGSQGSCKVGQAVMTGYETFGGHCARCHGENAEGSTFAPSLIDAIQDEGLGQGKFTRAVAQGMQVKDTTTGGWKVMPSWANNQAVVGNLTQIWAYLKARADGKLKPGRPQPLGKGNG